MRRKVAIKAEMAPEDLGSSIRVIWKGGINNQLPVENHADLHVDTEYEACIAIKQL